MKVLFIICNRYSFVSRLWLSSIFFILNYSLRSWLMYFWWQGAWKNFTKYSMLLPQNKHKIHVMYHMTLVLMNTHLTHNNLATWPCPPLWPRVVCHVFSMVWTNSFWMHISHTSCFLRSCFEKKSLVLLNCIIIHNYCVCYIKCVHEIIFTCLYQIFTSLWLNKWKMWMARRISLHI
jgi:hypothetical protein